MKPWAVLWFVWGCAHPHAMIGGVVEEVGETDLESEDSDSPAWVDVGAGAAFSCGVRGDGSVACWGDNTYGQTLVPAGGFLSVSAGWGHACGVREDQTLACWGYNSDQQVVVPSGTFQSVMAGYLATCGTRTDGSLVCWGELITDAPSGGLTSVSGKGYRACGIDVDHRLQCWGWIDDSEEEAPAEEFSSVSVYEHACGIRRGDAAVVCWWAGDPPVPEAVPPEGGFLSVDSGMELSCGIRTDSSVACWGGNVGSPPEGAFAKVSAGSQHACGLTVDGEIVCWGSNAVGQTDVPP